MLLQAVRKSLHTARTITLDKYCVVGDIELRNILESLLHRTKEYAVFVELCALLGNSLTNAHKVIDTRLLDHSSNLGIDIVATLQNIRQHEHCLALTCHRTKVIQRDGQRVQVGAIRVVDDNRIFDALLNLQAHSYGLQLRKVGGFVAHFGKECRHNLGITL